MLRRAMDKMRKISEIEEFLYYGGNELFSSLMENESDRAQALESLAFLLQKYAQTFWVKGRAGAYRYMIYQAKLSGYVKSNDLKAFRLTDDEKQRILHLTDEYIKSGGSKRKYLKKALEIILIVIIIALLVLAVYKWVMSDEYQRQIIQKNLDLSYLILSQT